ncbi:MAG: IS4 family transposase [Planctomycetota bacterium]
MTVVAVKEDWDVLLKFLPQGWEQKAGETGAIVRKRKIDSPETILRLLLIHLADGKSLRTTVAYAREANLCWINDVSLLHRLRASGDWLRWMAENIRDQISSTSDFNKFSEKFRIRLIDATVISEPGNTGSDWRLHYSLLLSSLGCDTCKISDYRLGESFVNFPVHPQDLLIGDRAYCNSQGIMHVVHHGGEVVVRFHSTGLPLHNYRGGPFPLLSHLRTLMSGQVGDWNVYIKTKGGHLIKGRLIAVRKSQEAIERTKKSLRQKASRQQRKLKPETLEYGEYFIVFTTVNRHKLKSDEVLSLYRLRWQIELSFKRLKSIMDLGHLHKSDPESCKSWLYGKLLVAFLVERIHQEAESFSPWGYPLRGGGRIQGAKNHSTLSQPLERN